MHYSEENVELPFTRIEEVEDEEAGGRTKNWGEGVATSLLNTSVSESITIDDPYEKYLNGLSPGEVPETLIVSSESSFIRSILVKLNKEKDVEAIVDSGSQIISMSEGLAHELGISYDPSVILQMQSANGAIKPSLGLARKVPCLIGDLLFFLNVHVIRNAPFHLLLSRPFDTLTESVVRN